MTECPNCGVALTFDEMDHAYTCGACGAPLVETLDIPCPQCGGVLLDGYCPSECRDEDCYYCLVCEREYSNEDLEGQY